MKPSFLLSTKFLLPPAGRGYLPRPNLIQWLQDHLDNRLILISAPAGYGKTSLLSEFLTKTNMPFAWYQLDSYDSDPTTFMTYFIESLRRMQGSVKSGERVIGQNASALLDSPQTGAEPLQVMTVLINELGEQLSNPTLVVMDDYHYTTSLVVHQLVDFLLEHGPINLHLIISTRTDPPLSLARLRARGILAEMRTNDLRFKENEVTELMLQDAPELSVESLSLLSEKTEGWAAAVQIVRSTLSGRDAEFASNVISSLSGSQRFVFEYLTEEVFRRQPVDSQRFLLRTCVLAQMDGASCNAIAHVKDAQHTLEQLEEQNIFVTSLDSERTWYRYHYLFREFLLSKLRHEMPDELKRLEIESGRYYARLLEWESAFQHYLQAGDPIAAAECACNFAADYVERGRSEALHRHLSSLPTEVMSQFPELLIQHGNVHWRMGKVGLAVESYQRAELVFAAQGQASGVSQALTHLAEIDRSQGNYISAQTLATQALDASPIDDHVARAEALMALAKSTGFLTGMDQGRALAEQAVEESRLAGARLSSLARANFLQSLGQICWWSGDPYAAIEHAQEALRLAPDELSPMAAKAYILLVSPYLYWREFQIALHYAEQGLGIAQTLHLNELLPAAYTALGNVLTRVGEMARAETALKQSLELAVQLGTASYEQIMATGYLALNLCSQGRVEEAWQLAEGALWVYRGHPDAYEVYVCRSVLADTALEKGLLERAESLYNELAVVGERRQFRIPLALVYLGLAYIHLVTGRKDTGIELASRAVHMIEHTRALQLFIDQGERSRLVCYALVEAGERSPFVDKVLENLPPQYRSVKIRFTDSSAISVRCMGNFKVLVGGQELTQEQWVSTKARDLLAYFITFRGERIPAEQAFEAIWAEKPGRGLTAFHTALTRLRNALRSQEPSPRFVLVEAGEYHLDAARFSIDVDEFDAALANARAISNDETAARWLEQAVGLYQGEYLGNLYYDWLFPERRRLSQEYLGALRQLADYHFMRERYTRSLDLLHRALRMDNLLEELHCQVMRVYAALGDRAGLIRQYQELNDVLGSEMGIEPLPATKKLYDRLLVGMEG
jgi:LuxR family transcriptional regulator, maltose regulon positive regulatory protein